MKTKESKLCSLFWVFVGTGSFLGISSWPGTQTCLVLLSAGFKFLCYHTQPKALSSKCLHFSPFQFRKQ